MPGRSGEIIRAPRSRAASCASSAIVRELGQPWQKKTGTPRGSPYSLSATVEPFASDRLCIDALINKENAGLPFVRAGWIMKIIPCGHGPILFRIYSYERQLSSGRQNLGSR